MEGEIFCNQCKTIPKENSIVKEAKVIIRQKLQAAQVTSVPVVGYLSTQLNLSPGLSNLGNTCFFNAVIQAIAFTAALHEFTPTEDHKLTITLFRLIQKLNTDRKGTINPKELFDILKSSWGVYGRYGQQDSHEVLRRLLDGIRNEQLGFNVNGTKIDQAANEFADTPSTSKTGDSDSIEPTKEMDIDQNDKQCEDELISPIKRSNTFIDQVFGGELVSAIVCTACKNVEDGKFKNYMASLGRQFKKNLFQQKKESEAPESISQKMNKISISTDVSLPREQVELIRTLLKTEDNQELKSNPSLSQCISKFFDIEILDNDNGFVCENCTKEKHRNMSEITLNRTLSDISLDSSNTDIDKIPIGAERVYTKAFKRYMLYTPPQVLVLHMKRFSQKGVRVAKVNNHVSFEQFLDISEFVAPPLHVDAKRERHVNSGNYRLYAVIVHTGNLNGGHYVAYIRKHSAAEDKTAWQYCSDNLVRFTTWQEVAKCRPYMLFYEKYNKQYI
ncbi:Ubiquitin carboxyl-terminal hydrolase 16 [Terramyces sp. JEL0728]|nr:Ubiquitin carboxyl-terminal hydrolase 16 [Terramyces sp. JEL0728]